VFLLLAGYSRTVSGCGETRRSQLGFEPPQQPLANSSRPGDIDQVGTGRLDLAHDFPGSGIDPKDPRRSAHHLPPASGFECHDCDPQLAARDPERKRPAEMGPFAYAGTVQVEALNAGVGPGSDEERLAVSRDAVRDLKLAGPVPLLPHDRTRRPAAVRSCEEMNLTIEPIDHLP
jgi:hypothetical protein